MDINIRMICEKDYKKVEELLVGICRQHALGRNDILVDSGAKYDTDDIAKIAACIYTPILIAENEKGEAVGYAFCELRDYPESGARKAYRCMYIDDFCIDGKYRKQGIGRRLIEAVKELAKKEGCYNIELNVWEFNENAIHFYKKCGLGTQRRQMELILD